jgi:hypothetical protein
VERRRMMTRERLVRALHGRREMQEETLSRSEAWSMMPQKRLREAPQAWYDLDISRAEC